MNFFDHIKNCFVKYTDFSGRSSRAEYWNFFVFIAILTLISDYLDALMSGESYMYYSGFGALYIISSLLTFFPSLAVSVRRLHDINKSGWWLMLAVTIIGLIPLIYWACLPSNTGDNKYA